MGAGESYARDLHAAFGQLARYPELGRRIDHIRPGYRRFEHGSHSVYYRGSDDPLLIVRVLHRRMRPEGRV